MITICTGASKVIPKSPYLYKDYLLETIPLYKTIVPREEDILRDNFSLAFLNILTGINLSKPTSMLQKQIPVFSQLDYTKVLAPSQKEPVENDNPPKEVVEKPNVEPKPAVPVTNPIENKGINIYIYHSHTTETYVPTKGMTHTTDFSKTIVKVGEELTKALTQLGANVIHDKTHHNRRQADSYNNSRVTVNKALAMDLDFDLIIDLHRDGVGLTSDVGKPITTVNLDGKNMGKLLFVVGQRHDGWRNNYKISQNLNSITQELHPGLTRGIILKPSSNYNQDLNGKVVLIEIGGHWNTLEEAINTTKPLAEIIIKALTN